MATNCLGMQHSLCTTSLQRRQATRQQMQKPSSAISRDLRQQKSARWGQSQRQLRICRAGEEKAEAAAEEPATESQDIVTFDALTEQAKEQVAGASIDGEFMASYVGAAEAEVADIKKALTAAEAAAIELEGKLAQANDKLLRLTADFDNFRKRTTNEKIGLTSGAKADVVLQLLPVVDNFEMAKSQLKLETEGEEKVDASYQGLYRQLVDIFRSLGVEVVPGEGSPFDPEVHEAIMREPSDDVPDGTVLQEFRKGFRLGDRLLRPAMVKVSFSDTVPAVKVSSEGGDGGEQEKEDVAA